MSKTASQIENSSIVQIAREHGCKAQTIKGIVSYVRKHGVKSKSRLANIGKSYARKTAIKPIDLRSKLVAICDASLAAKASRFARDENPRKRNWELSDPSVAESFRTGSISENNLGRYSSRCTYTHYTYTPRYHSAVRVFRSGDTVFFGQEGKWKTILAPKGMKFATDDNGVKLVRVSDGMDYHPTSDDFKARNFATRVRKAMAANYIKRMEVKRLEREQAKRDEIFRRDLKTTMVTLNDSRKAGNCVEGSLAFAEKKLHISREEVLSGGHLFAVRADRLLRVANGDTQKAMAAVRVAWMRETTVSI